MATEVLSIEVKEDGSRVVRRAIEGVGEASERTDRKVTKLQKGLSNFASQISPINQLRTAIGGLGATLAIRKILGDFVLFDDKIGEISTLVDKTKFNMESLTDSIRDQAKAFGSLPTEQAVAAYSIISAGASSASEATEILTAANKLAVGGVTDVATAADGLTSILNAYGSEVESAESVTDALFVAMRAGKTTIGELSRSMGLVAPLAKEAGVSFDELAGSISALTKGGISTRVAVTGVRAIIASVIKPTSEASKAAKRLGLEFNSAALASKGFKGFLDDIVSKTKGSRDEIAKLFGGVEALVPVFALAGTAGESLNEILADMGNKAGATDEAFEKIDRGAGAQIQKLFANVRDLGISLGQSIITTLLPAITALNNNFGDVVTTAGVIFSVFAASKFATIATAIVGVTSQVVALGVALLANPITLIATAVAAATSALIIFKDDIKLTEDGVVSLGDVISVVLDRIKTFFGDAVTTITKAWSSAIDFLKASTEGYFELFIDNLIALPSKVISTLDTIIGFFSGAAKAIGILWGALKNKLTGPIESAIEAIKTKFNEFKTFISEIVESIKTKWNELIEPLKEPFEKVSTFVSNIFDSVKETVGIGIQNLKTEASELSDAVAEGVKDFVDSSPALKDAGQAIADGMTETTVIQDFLNSAATEAGKLFTGIVDDARAKKEALQPPATGASDPVKELQAGETLPDKAPGLLSQEQLEEQLGQFDFLLDGTRLYNESRLQNYQDTETKIKALRDQGKIDETTASQLITKVEAEQFKIRTNTARGFFDGISILAKSGNKKVADVGRAAAITVATIDGIVQVQKAYASAPPPANFALATQAGVIAASNVARIVATRRLGGDLNSGQLSRVGEGTRPEIFTGASGQQFLIPPERGRVEPVRSRETVASGGQAQQNIGIDLTTRVEESAESFARTLTESFSTPRIEREVLAVLERNPESVRQYLN